MFEPTFPILLAALQDNEATVVLLVIITIVGALAWSWVKTERDHRIAAQRRALDAEHALRAAEASSEAPDSVNARRTETMFEQHRRINQLTIAKLESEVQLLQAQIITREGVRDREEAGKEYHELMVEKTKLEMDSLRLHIAELRKRMEDWDAG